MKQKEINPELMHSGVSDHLWEDRKYKNLGLIVCSPIKNKRVVIANISSQGVVIVQIKEDKKTQFKLSIASGSLLKNGQPCTEQEKKIFKRRLALMSKSMLDVPYFLFKKQKREVQMSAYHTILKKAGVQKERYYQRIESKNLLKAIATKFNHISDFLSDEKREKATSVNDINEIANSLLTSQMKSVTISQSRKKTQKPLQLTINRNGIEVTRKEEKKPFELRYEFYSKSLFKDNQKVELDFMDLLYESIDEIEGNLKEGETDIYYQKGATL